MSDDPPPRKPKRVATKAPTSARAAPLPFDPGDERQLALLFSDDAPQPGLLPDRPGTDGE
jgi:hypothetical protein